MERYHNPQTDPLPIRSPYHEAERQRLEQLTAEFLAKGGQVQQVGHQMRDKYPFVIDARRTPVYADLLDHRKSRRANRLNNNPLPRQSPSTSFHQVCSIQERWPLA